MMLLYKYRTQQLAATSLSLCVALASIGPGIAIACEGGEPQVISVKPIVWSGGGECPIKEARVHFTIVGQWCEYAIKNENLVEKVNVQLTELGFELGCFGGGGNCVGITPAGKAPECEKGLKLAVAGECYDRLEYLKKPAAKSTVSFAVETHSEPNNVPLLKIVDQTVE
jgi:hypothetical protein